MNFKKDDIGKRKHVSQMTEKEKLIIWSRLNSIKDHEWIITNYALNRLAKRNIMATREDVISTIYNSTIVEYRIIHNKKFNNYDERVVLRSKSVVNEDYNLHVVYSLTYKAVVSVWMNHVKDFHKTLDWSLYSEDMNVAGA